MCAPSILKSLLNWTFFDTFSQMGVAYFALKIF